MQRLSGQDAFFLYRETPTTQQHTLKVAIYEPPVPAQSYAEIKEGMARHLHLMPLLRRRLVWVPLRLHHPVWIEDPDFDLDHHIRRAGVPFPGGPRQLDQMISEIASHSLDRSHPLWELWLLEGLEGGRQAAVLKMHHAMADGTAAAALIQNTAVFSAAEHPSSPDQPWQPDAVPSAGRLLRDAAVDHIRLLFRLPRMVARTSRGLRQLIAARRAAEIAVPIGYDTPHTPFNNALRARRVFATTSLALDDCKRVKEAFGVTLNDIVLALCGGSLRRWLDGRGLLTGRPLVASIPVGADQGGGAPRLFGNRVAYFQTALRIDLADPVERLLATRAVTMEAKRELEVIGRQTAGEWMEYLPPLPYTWVKRLHSYFRLADFYPSPSNLVVSNVPGPRVPLYWSGAKLVELYSVGPLSEGIGLNLTVWSYGDRMYCALLACHEQVSDPHAITEGMHDELRLLLDAAAERQRRAG